VIMDKALVIEQVAVIKNYEDYHRQGLPLNPNYTLIGELLKEQQEYIAELELELQKALLQNGNKTDTKPSDN